MKLTNRFTKISKWFFAFVLLAIFSCSKGDESVDPQAVQQENFIGLSLAQEIAGEIKFNENTNSTQTGKNSSPTIIKKKIETIDGVKNDEGKTVFYVVNYIEGGYIILAADNRATPIIGFSEDKKFVIDNSKDISYPTGLRYWMKSAKEQITVIQNSKLKQTDKERSVWVQVKNILVNQSLTAKAPVDNCYDHVTTNVKDPLLKSFWNQDNGFNSEMPYISCNGMTYRALAGCVPIAMAQTMRYYQYPARYNWTLMDLTSSTYATATFILDIHNAIGSLYPGQPSFRCDGTGVSNSADMGEVLKTKFGYSSASCDDYNYQTVKNNLANGQPVILSGNNGSGGHMWVCDGYRATKYDFADCTGVSALYFHMNWGWGQYGNNGFFALNDFSLSETGSNNGTGYNKGVKMIYNIRP